MINISSNCTAFQSSISKWSYNTKEANNALTGYSPQGYAFHTCYEDEAWWICDLNDTYSLSYIDIFLRDNYGSRNYNLKVEVSLDLKKYIQINDLQLIKEKNLITARIDNIPVRFVRISVNNNFLHLKQVSIFSNKKLIKFRDIYLVLDNTIDHDIINCIKNNTYERSEINYVLDNYTDNDKILELGASIGGMSSIIGKLFNPETYTAVEANKELIDILRLNNLINDAKVNVLNYAVSDKEGFSDFYICDKCWSSSLTPIKDAIRIDKVKNISLNRLILESNANFLICDIEGGEYEIFNDNVNINQINKICIEIHKNSIDKMINLYNFFIKHGFICDKHPPLEIKQDVYFFYRNPVHNTIDVV